MREIKFRAWNKVSQKWDYFTPENIFENIQTLDGEMNGEQWKYFVFSQVDGRFVVSGKDSDDLENKLKTIGEKYPDFYGDWIGPGFDIVKANKLSDAKIKLNGRTKT
jgi:hypothetical protein